MAKKCFKCGVAITSGMYCLAHKPKADDDRRLAPYDLRNRVDHDTKPLDAETGLSSGLRDGALTPGGRPKR